MMPNESFPTEQFDALAAISFCRHAFVGRLPGLDVRTDKDEALRRLESMHREVRAACGFAGIPLVTGEQVHGDRIQVIDKPVESDLRFDDCDGLITDQSGVGLGIHVADCAAVYIVDPVRRAIGLVHSGKKGTELGIAPKAIVLMQDRFGSTPRDLVVQISPCIRPPHYELDFAAAILQQCREAGAEQVCDAGVCTACEPERYYSYRLEKGRTGRMLALLAIASP